MSLRRRTLLTMILLLIGMIVVLYFALQRIIVSSFETAERTHVTRDIRRAEAALERVLEDVYRGQVDWSSWTATYDYVTERDPAFAEENLTQISLDTLDLDFMMLLDSAGAEVNWLARPEYPSSALLRQPDAAGAPLLDAITARGSSAFFALVDGLPMIVSVRPILNSFSEPPAGGAMIWGRVIDRALLDRLASMLQMEITLEVNTSTAETMQAIVTQGNSAVGTSAIDAVGGIFYLNVTVPRDLLTQVELSVLQFSGALILFGCVVVVGVFLLIDTLLLGRIARMIDAVKWIGAPGAPPQIAVEGRDELSALARTINAMLQQSIDARAALETLNADQDRLISERTAALTAQEAQLRAIVDTMGEGLIYNIDGRMALVNSALAEMTGYQTADLIDKPFRLLLSQPENISTQDLTRRPDRFETRLVQQDGGHIDVAITATPLPIFDGKRRRVIVVRDVTRERALQRQRDYFFARASHELRTPLSNIMTRLYLIERDRAGMPHHLAVMDKVSRQMLTLLNDLLDVARLETGIPIKKQPIDLRLVVQEVIEVQQPDADNKTIGVTVSLPPMPLLVYADATRINQVLTNIVRNAVLYTPIAGAITVDARCDEMTDRVVVRVQNSGAGIAAEHLPHLFEPFFRVTEGGVGAGLGLFITREILDLHDGTIAVESTPDLHTTFAISLAVYHESL